jgi:hypothetical protein
MPVVLELNELNMRIRMKLFMINSEKNCNIKNILNTGEGGAGRFVPFRMIVGQQ